MIHGLSNNLLFTAGPGVSAISGTTKLVTHSGGPEGVLLKKVGSIQDAVNCGGIYLYNGERSVMYVGDSLKKVISKSKLGKVAAWTALNGVTTTACKLVTMAHWDHILTWKSGLNVVGSVSTPSGQLSPRIAEKDFFPFSGDVYALGVVCSATDGMWQSRSIDLFPGDIYGTGMPAVTYESIGYMSTEIALPDTFDTFMTRVYNTAMSAVPAGAQQYYADTFKLTIDACSFKQVRPTVAVCSYWKGQAEWDGATFGPLRSSFPQVGGPSGWGAGLAGGRWPTGTQKGGEGSYNSTATKEGHIEYVFVPGFYYAGCDDMPWLVHQDVLCTQAKNLKPPSGAVAGLKVGELADLHSLERSLVRGIRRATLPSSHTDLVDFVLHPLDESFVPYAASYDTADVVQVEVQSRSSQPVTPSNAISIFDKGSLKNMVSRFSELWDEAALTRARASS